MTNKDQICHCPQFHKGKCTPETAKNYPKFPNLQKLVKKIAKQKSKY